jgi:hypothetical protein
VKLYVNALSSGGYALDAFNPDGTRDNDSIAIRKAIAKADLTDTFVKLEAKRYFYDGDIITADQVRIYGSGMPQPNLAKTALESGSIIDGPFLFVVQDAEFRDFGVDVGSDSDATAQDALRCNAPVVNEGGHLHTENIVGLARSSSVNHALLFQSYQKHTGTNLLGIYGLFGFVSKCRNVSLGTVNTIENDESGVILKSDTAFGKCGNVSIERVVCEGNASQKRGFHVQASTEEVRDVYVGSIQASGCDENVLVQIGSSGLGMRNIYLGDVKSKDARIKDFGIENLDADGVILNINVNSLVTENTAVYGIRATGSGVTRDINFGTVFISYEPAATQETMNFAVFFGGATTKTRIDDLTILRNYSTSQIGGIQYQANPENHVLGSHIATVFGPGRPSPGVSDPLLSGTGNSLSIPANNAGEGYSFVRAKPTETGVEINEFEDPVSGSSSFAKGHRLTIINNSLFAMSVLHNPSNGIFNSGAATVGIPANETKSWVYGGNNTWHQT